MKVELRGFDDSGKVVTEGIITLVDGKLSGDTELAKRVIAEPYFDTSTRKRLTAKDGEAFLRGLHIAINGSRLWATKAE